MQPFRFTENRVWRCYLGGKMIDALRGKPESQCKDTLFPEDWIASVVEARNPQHPVPGEGISRAVIDGREVSFADLVEARSEDLFGPGHVRALGRTPGFLMKLLDSAIRLPLQAHPDRETARRLYNSPYGKTEAWIVLATRRIDNEEPYLLLGFNETLDPDVFVHDCIAGDMRRPLAMVHKHAVHPGDVLLLRGGLVHAIGPGVFLVEIMEPTDWVTQPDPVCGTQPLTIEDRFGPLPPEKAMEVFHFEAMSREDAWRSAALDPVVEEEQGRSRRVRLIGPDATTLFGARRLEVQGEWTDDTRVSGCFAGAVIEGALELRWRDRVIELHRGDTFFVPWAAGPYSCRGQARVVCALPPTVESR